MKLTHWTDDTDSQLKTETDSDTFTMQAFFSGKYLKICLIRFDQSLQPINWLSRATVGVKNNGNLKSNVSDKCSKKLDHFTNSLLKLSSLLGIVRNTVLAILRCKIFLSFFVVKSSSLSYHHHKKMLLTLRPGDNLIKILS